MAGRQKESADIAKILMSLPKWKRIATGRGYSISAQPRWILRLSRANCVKERKAPKDAETRLCDPSVLAKGFTAHRGVIVHGIFDVDDFCFHFLSRI